MIQEAEQECRLSEASKLSCWRVIWDEFSLYGQFLGIVLICVCKENILITQLLKRDMIAKSNFRRKNLASSTSGGKSFNSADNWTRCSPVLGLLGTQKSSSSKNVLIVEEMLRWKPLTFKDGRASLWWTKSLGSHWPKLRQQDAAKMKLSRDLKIDFLKNWSDVEHESKKIL